MEIFNYFTLLVAVTFTLVHLTAGSNYNLTTAETDALKQFRPIAEKIVSHDYMKTDRYLLKFLQARDLNVQNAAEMLRAAVQWRNENNIDTILQEDFSLYDDHFKLINGGFDKEGRPIIISPFGLYDVRKFVLAGKLPQLLRYLDRLQELSETGLRLLIGDSGNFTNAVTIIDLGGFSLRKQACALCLTAIPHMFRTLENYYPGFFHRVFLINTPSVFIPILNLIRPFLSKSTAEGLRVFGYDKNEWSPELLNEISPDQLPTQLGGTKVVEFTSDWRKANPEVAALIQTKPKPKKSSTK